MKLNTFLRALDQKSIGIGWFENSNVQWGFSPQLKNTHHCLFVRSFTIWPRFTAKSLLSPKHLKKWMCAVHVSRVQFTRVTVFVFFVACFSENGVSCVYFNSHQLFNATVEIWTMKFDAIKAYQLIRNGIMHITSHSLLIDLLAAS